MTFLSSLFGQDRPRTPSQTAARREALRVALRDTLNRHGIPPAWIGAETLVATSRGAEPGIHWRLLIKHWDPRLMTYGVPFQQSLVKRLKSLDPKSATWLMGVSWQFALPDESACPPMPLAGFWTAEAPAPAQPAKRAAAPIVAAPIAPVAPALTAKEALDQLFAERDAEHGRHPGFEKTQPMFQKTEPSPLE